MSDELPTGKGPNAFRTISEVAVEIGVPQHVLRFWETRFTQLQPLKRGGNRRYYRPADVALLRDIQRMLSVEGLTIKGVQKRLAGGEAAPAAPMASAPPDLRAIRDRLAAALAASRATP